MLVEIRFLHNLFLKFSLSLIVEKKPNTKKICFTLNHDMFMSEKSYKFRRFLFYVFYFIPLFFGLLFCWKSQAISIFCWISCKTAFICRFACFQLFVFWRIKLFLFHANDSGQIWQRKNGNYRVICDEICERETWRCRWTRTCFMGLCGRWLIPKWHDLGNLRAKLI